MTETQKLIEAFLARGGAITRVPERNFHRKNYEAPILKNRRILADLQERAKKNMAD